jgi:hypothetical protein
MFIVSNHSVKLPPIEIILELAVKSSAPKGDFKWGFYCIHCHGNVKSLDSGS